MEKHAEFVDVVVAGTSSCENTSMDDSSSRTDVESNGFSPLQTKLLLRKIDRTLVPFLALLYLMSFLDRANIGNAKLAGLEKDLKMTGEWDYTAAVAVFFPTYILSEIPSNLAMKRFRPSVWIPSIMVAWSILTVMLGAVKDLGGLLAVRCLLGLAEGGLFPGISYFITLWYRRHECGSRIAIFFSAATAAGAFGGLLARGIMKMEGVGGLHGWAWIFIIEGLVTFIIAVMAYFMMHDYPDTAKFLTPAEKEEVVRRLEEDRCVLSDRFELKFVADALKDWKIWVHTIIGIGIATPVYSVSIFLPTIIAGMGYTNETAQLMSVPPYVVACAMTVSGGFIADRHGQRGLYVIISCSVAIVGFILLAAVESHGVKYLACFLVTTGIFSNVPQSTAWIGNNIGGSVKRGVGLAINVGVGSIGGVIAGFVFRKQDAPRYISGHVILLSMVSVSLMLATFMTWWLRGENARRDREYKPPSEYTREEMEFETDKGDYAPFFRYTV